MIVTDILQIVLLVGLFWIARDVDRALYLNGIGWLIIGLLFYCCGVGVQWLAFRGRLSIPNVRRLVFLTGPSVLMAGYFAISPILFLKSGATKERDGAAMVQKVPLDFREQWAQNHLGHVHSEVLLCAVLALALLILYVVQSQSMLRDIGTKKDAVSS